MRSAHSAGYQGTLAAYSELYNVLCTSIDPCVSSCVAAGGTTASCTAGSECVQGSDRTYCLPPTYWRYEDRATAADGDTAEQTLVRIAYQDPLLLRDFGIELPAGATIRGIAFDVLRGSDSEGVAVDHAVRVLRDGQPDGRRQEAADRHLARQSRLRHLRRTLPTPGESPGRRPT